jgi:hypothetical protein
MAKQVKEIPNTVSETNSTSRNLYVSVKTFEGTTGKTIGERVVDMYHYGTRSWLQNHVWWAMHNGHQTEQTPATPEEITKYFETAKVALANKFNSEADKHPIVPANEAVAA